MDCRAQLASLAIEELDKGDFLMATKILTTGIRLEPNNHELYLERSICHHKLGNLQASLDDVNTAIRLKPCDHNVHYQKGLTLLGFDDFEMLNEARISFKKAIEMCARQEESKLKDIFDLLAQSTKEMGIARKRLYENLNLQGRPEVTIPTNLDEDIPSSQVQGTVGNDPVDSTTDRQLSIEPGTSSIHKSMVSLENHLINNDSNNLVSNQRNIIQPMSNQSQAPDDVSGPSKVITHNSSNNNNNDTSNNNNSNIICNNRVTSSASHINSLNLPSMNTSPDISRIREVEAPALAADLMASNEHVDQLKAEQFAWNIRRSERIFLHGTNETPGTSGIHIGILTRNSEPILHSSQQLIQGTSSNPSLINGGNMIPVKRPHDTAISQAYHPNKSIRSKDSTISHAESDVDVDDSYNNTSTPATTPNSSDIVNSNRKRVLIAPSSSMPAANLTPSTSNSSKDDSYSSKYKRLRRDRERARRGTSKLCTIKPSDLEELQKFSNSDPGKRAMRVIAPIDGWLYSGQLRVDDENNSKDATIPQYVVKLDGDATGSSYLFSQETVLNDVIKEVRVNSVSELRKGARICCYWSRQYKCLSTGVVTSRTFEATKSLVSVKYDNGDLSALPLEDLRLLPPDYPKYMSNCDPLLLAKNEEGTYTTNAVPSNSNTNVNQNGARVVIVENKSPKSDLRAINNASPSKINTSSVNIKQCLKEADESLATVENNTNMVATSYQVLQNQESVLEVEREDFKDDMDESTFEDETFTFKEDKTEENHKEIRNEEDEEDDEDDTIPPTDETIDFITSETLPEIKNESKHISTERMDMIQITKDNMTITNEIRLSMQNGQDSTEENNYNMAYCPWLFEGPPRRSKRHGRTYRDNYNSIRRGNEVIRVGDSAELMPRDESILPFIAKIDGLWATGRGEMRVRVRWYYRLIETEGEPYKLQDGENALFETDHLDENDVQSIYRSTKILSWTDYSNNNLGHVNKNNDSNSKIFYLAGYYDPVRRVKHLKSDVKEAL